MHAEIKSRLNSGNASYHVVYNFFSPPQDYYLIYKDMSIYLEFCLLFHMGVTTSGKTKAEGVQEEGAAADIWALQEGSNRIEGKWHKQEFCEPYSSSNIIGVIKSRRMRQSGHTAHM